MVQTVLDEGKVLQLKFYEGFRSLTRDRKPVAAAPVTSKEMVSNKNIWHDPKIEEMRNPEDPAFTISLLSRANQGFIICAHVMAFLAGEECLYTNGWAKENKRAANAISQNIVGLKMYKEVEDADLSDFAYGKNHPEIIITKGMLEEAKIRFPITINGEFDDSYADVMDIEESIKAQSKKEKEPNFVFVTPEPPKAEEPKKEQPEKEKKEEEPKKPEEKPEAEASGNDSAESEPKDEKPQEEEEKKAKSPIFNFDNMNLYADFDFVDVTPAQKRDVAAIFGKFIGNRTYQLNRIPSGYIQMVINDNDQVRSVINIDPGLCIGNGYNVVGNIPGANGKLANIMVHHTEEEIINKIFNNPQYILNPNEITKCMSHMFLNQSIYHWIDMSNMKSRLEKLSDDDFKKLGKKFTFMINSLKEEDRARFRINEWNGIDDFTLISDKKCKSPFPGDTSDKINGIEIRVKEDAIGVTFPNQIYEEYKIDDYGLL